MFQVERPIKKEGGEEMCHCDIPFIGSQRERFCVAANTEDSRKSFSVWHPTYELAMQEAERLCRRENKEFLVMKVISSCKVGPMPVVWQEYAK